VLKSISRLADRVWSNDQRTLAARYRAMIARFEDTRDLRLLGGYQTGVDPVLDRAVEMTPRLYTLLKQTPRDPPTVDPFAKLGANLPAIPAD
jgi:flagellum-specific ATP synthase